MNQGTKWVLLMKKNRSRKSRASVPFISYLQYIGLLKYKQAIAEVQKIKEIYINDEDQEQT
jgi:hypothetical protein